MIDVSNKAVPVLLTLITIYKIYITLVALTCTLRSEVIVRFVDMRAIADLHCLKFIFVITAVRPYDKIKSKKFNTVGTGPNSNRTKMERGKIDTPNTQARHHSLSCLLHALQ